MKYPNQIKIRGEERSGFTAKDIEQLKAIRLQGDFCTIAGTIKTKEAADFAMKQMEWLSKHPNETDAWTAVQNLR